MSQTPLTLIIGRLVADTAGEAIPAAVLQRAKVSLLHNLAVGLAGRGRETIAHAMAKEFWASPAEATLLRDGARVSVEAAAFANAALINARSQDDTHAGSTSHPGSPTMAAALAVAEAEGRSGAEFLAAVVLGYEALCRIGRDFDHRLTARGYRAAAVLAGFGATAAAARLLRMPAQKTAHALGLAANLAGGLAQVWREGSGESALQLGFAARNGITAARAAGLGATAAAFALEGEAGLYRALADSAEPPVEALAGCGQDWQFLEVTIKPYPVCAILQGPVGLLLGLLEAVPAPEALAEIALELSPYEAAYPGIDFGGPFASSIATKMSAQFSLALAAIDGRVTPEGLGRVDDPAVLALSRRVRVVADPAVAPRLCRLRLHLRDGRVLSGAVSQPVGQPTFAEVAAFARALAAEMGADAAAVDRLAAAVDALDEAPDVSRLLAAVVAC